MTTEPPTASSLELRASDADRERVVEELRDAEFTSDEVVITAVALMGGVDIIVPEGMEVEVGGMALMGDKSARLADVPLRGDLPRLRVRAYALMGGVGVKSKPPRGESKRLER